MFGEPPLEVDLNDDFLHRDCADDAYWQSILERWERLSQEVVDHLGKLDVAMVSATEHQNAAAPDPRF